MGWLLKGDHVITQGSGDSALWLTNTAPYGQDGKHLLSLSLALLSLGTLLALSVSDTFFGLLFRATVTTKPNFVCILLRWIFNGCVIIWNVSKVLVKLILLIMIFIVIVFFFFFRKALFYSHLTIFAICSKLISKITCQLNLQNSKLSKLIILCV